MTKTKSTPRILIVTPEVTYLPPGMGNIANNLSAKAGGLADVSAALISSLFDLGADIHVALPDYRTLFDAHLPLVVSREIDTILDKMPESRIHLAEDREESHRDHETPGDSYQEGTEDPERSDDDHGNDGEPNRDVQGLAEVVSFCGHACLLSSSALEWGSSEGWYTGWGMSKTVLPRGCQDGDELPGDAPEGILMGRRS